MYCPGGPLLATNKSIALDLGFGLGLGLGLYGYGVRIIGS